MLRIPESLKTFRVQILLFTLLALLALLFFRASYVSNFQATPEAVLVSVNPDWLGPPENLPNDLSVWEKFEKDVIETNPVAGLVVTKVDRTGRERIVYPFYLLLVDPDYFASMGKRAERRPIVKGDDIYGYLYVHLDPGRLRAFNTVFWILFFLILSGSSTALIRFRFQQRNIETISVQLEEKKRQLTDLEKLALVGQLTANILHDLKKPMLNIREESGFLPDGDIKDEIRQQADLFLTMLRELNLEGFLTVGSGAKEEFVDLEEIIRQSLNLVKYEAGNVEIEFQFGRDTPFILATKHRLIQVFSNLFLNAFEAMKGQGRLRVECERLQTDEGLFAETKITDSGGGILEEALSKVFEPFYSYGKEGQSTGLGLYITREIINDLGGDIEVDVQPGVGTTFTVLLPATLDQE